MKKNILIAILAFMSMSTVVMAQNNNGRGSRQRIDPTEMYARMGERLVKQMKLDDEKAEVFKVLYLDYQMARRNAANPKGENEAQERVDFNKLTDEKATELIQKSIATQEAQTKVDKDYLPKFLEILTPTQAAQIYLQRQGGMNRQGGEGRMGNGRIGGFGGPGGGFGGGFGGPGNDF